MDYVSDMKMNMALVKSKIRPWTDKEGKERYYINNVPYLISDYRSATNCELCSYYDHEMMRASGGRVREIIEQYNPSCDLEVDGGINAETAKLVVEAGANVLVAGSAVYGAADIDAAIQSLRVK
jgi:hypothetical protein